MKPVQDNHAALHGGFHWRVPRRFNIAQACCTRWARQTPDAVAIRWEHEDGRRGRVTYAQLQAAADQAKADLQVSIARRLKAAEDQIASAEASALKEVKDRAVQVAVAAAGEVLANQMSAGDKSGMIDTAIDEVATRLN